MEESNNMKICNQDEYELTYRAMAPDRTIHQVVYNNSKGKNGYIHNKNYTEDDSFYAPYLVYKIGEKVGVNVPETELGQILHLNVDKDYYRDSFFESSIVYDDNLGDMKGFRINHGFSHVAPEVIFSSYLAENEGIANKRREEIRGRATSQTVDDYVNSYIYYLTTRGSKPREEYSKTEIDKMKQELIDRALFSLKLGTHSNFDVTLFNHKDAKLDPYYLSSRNMFSLNVSNEEWANESLSKSDDEFKKVMESEYIPQYGLAPNVFVPKAGDVVKYIFEKYPEQAKKSYEKLSKFTSKDFKDELDNCTRMSDVHKKFAMRVFDVRDKEFAEIYQEHLKSQTR